MTTDEIWKRAVDIAQIVSAVATFATVVVATRLWAKQYNPRLRVTITEARVSSPIGSSEYVSVGVTNVGLTPVIVSGLQYRPYGKYRNRWFQIPDYENPLSAQLPLRLAPGETNQFLFPPGRWFDVASDMIHRGYMSSFLVRMLWKRRFRVELLTTTGEAFPARPPKAIIRRLERERMAKFVELAMAPVDEPA